MPLLLALVFWPARWWQSCLWLLCGLIIDIDHLLADPIYDPERCSIGFHPLHSGYAMAIYAVLLLASVRLSVGQSHLSWWFRLRLILIGVVLHLILDALDCIF